MGHKCEADGCDKDGIHHMDVNSDDFNSRACSFHAAEQAMQDMSGADARLALRLAGHAAEDAPPPDLAAENERLREALRFYANETNYFEIADAASPGTLLSPGTVEEAVLPDCGGIARAALAAGKKEGA